MRYLLVGLFLAGCSAPPPPDPEPKRSNVLKILDGVAERREDPRARARCLQQARTSSRCPPNSNPRRILPLRIVLDRRYTARGLGWKKRLQRTVGCANALFPPGLGFSLQRIEPWDPGADRRSLLALFGRLKREHPADGAALVVGFTVLDRGQVFGRTGDAIGLSKGVSTVVTSWPLEENDCAILAHELAHLVGAKHVRGKQWLMNRTGRPFHLPSDGAKWRVLSRYRFHPRNIEVMLLYAGSRITPRGLMLRRSCINLRKGIDRCWAL